LKKKKKEWKLLALARVRRESWGKSKKGTGRVGGFLPAAGGTS